MKNTKILQIENICIDRDSNNYTVSELIKSTKGVNAGELVQRGQTYYPSLKLALMNVRERLRGIEYDKMADTQIVDLVNALEMADRKMEKLINDTFKK